MRRIGFVGYAVWADAMAPAAMQAAAAAMDTSRLRVRRGIMHFSISVDIAEARRAAAAPLRIQDFISRREDTFPSCFPILVRCKMHFAAGSNNCRHSPAARHSGLGSVGSLP